MPHGRLDLCMCAPATGAGICGRLVMNNRGRCFSIGEAHLGRRRCSCCMHALRPLPLLCWCPQPRQGPPQRSQPQGQRPLTPRAGGAPGRSAVPPLPLPSPLGFRTHRPRTACNAGARRRDGVDPRSPVAAAGHHVGSQRVPPYPLDVVPVVLQEVLWAACAIPAGKGASAKKRNQHVKRLGRALSRADPGLFLSPPRLHETSEKAVRRFGG